MSNDTVSDMLTQIRNAIAVKHRFVIIPKTRMTLAITKVLEKEGYILSYEEFNHQIIEDGPNKSKKNYLANNCNWIKVFRYGA
jgi:ribosomal protein S8